ncbi:Ribonuclease h domain [Thalictrum thalictroides]|uniref:Ribonuclease h domain n=1 Tax=Thalictrum thalictroides TaxID=46969 RepID=A0A7J6V2Q8_THATH|nr:Ribonuclease h domain [Thalictrum thalictroides]
MAWNEAAYHGLMFNIVCRKPTLWVKWIGTYKIKSKGFWTMTIPNDVSWVWRAILKTREPARKNIKYLIANGKDIDIWEDPWSNLGPLKLNPQVVSSWCPTIPQAPLDSIITSRSVNASLISLLPGVEAEVLSQVSVLTQLNKDRLSWTPNSAGTFTTRNAYQAMMQDSEKVK